MAALAGYELSKNKLKFFFVVSFVGPYPSSLDQRQRGSPGRAGCRTALMVSKKERRRPVEGKRVVMWFLHWFGIRNLDRGRVEG